jgi:SAM-dependent methyltransferase
MRPGHCLETYSRDEVVAYYAQYVELQKPEAQILRRLAPSLPAMRMLELGVGAGRITGHYAPRAAQYRAIDLCPRMVEECRRRFAGRLAPESFAVGDMRSLGGYAPGSFDLVFISYNTVDHLTLPERDGLTAQARRILSPGGFFCFSSHNIACLGDWLALGRWMGAGFWRHPRSGVRRLRLRARLRELNRAALEQHAGADHVLINNGTHDDLELRSYYVRASFQTGELAKAGFSSVSVFSLDSGMELKATEIETARDRWLYYLAS